ncbi:calcium/calmodulin-dependent 3',5'-cyclic nucleotide phosphodiesterase 1-like isoform X2 [Cimex lectularius]|uniref:Phosphodiesterase n=1 Tax=Cimex lectularius TaxID=79782 RepID=A0A8I6S4N7_CIMLE|nr:calcium/calmodulin-dependent 3',5'-cyclic nucleotide phosphodiesterase 1-like isoform X2 [Cimex lectularius]
MDWSNISDTVKSLSVLLRRKMESPTRSNRNPEPAEPSPTYSLPSQPSPRAQQPLNKRESARIQLDGATYTIVASSSEHPAKDETSTHSSIPRSNGQVNKSGPLTIVRRGGNRKTGEKHETERIPINSDDDLLERLDHDPDLAITYDSPDACENAALRLRGLLGQIQKGEISAETLQKHILFAAKVLEAIFIDENKRQAEEDDELSEVQPDAVPPEVREWLASTFTRQLGTTKRKSDEKPKFKSVAHAIRAGIFVDRIYRRVNTAAMMQFPPEVVKVLKTLDEWSFDVFALHDSSGGQPIKFLSYDLLNRYGIMHKFKIVPASLENFLLKIEEGYGKFKNPYHNNLHAADVTQTVHYMLCKTGLMNWLTDLEIFATLFAALIHDFEHTGTTNNFHVMSGSETALLYNDRAVLENHHISSSFRVLKEDDCNILQNLSREEYREFRTLVIDMVLATDMSFHFQQLKTMKNLITLADATIEKSKALSLVLHCCDISHPAKRWELHQRWTTQLLEEFFRQGDKERELNLPFSPLCDRNNIMVAESQIGFIDFIVDPSMAVCSDMLEVILAPEKPNPKKELETETEPFVLTKPWLACLADNKRHWRDKAVHEAAQNEKKESDQKLDS